MKSLSTSKPVPPISTTFVALEDSPTAAEELTSAVRQRLSVPLVVNLAAPSLVRAAEEAADRVYWISCEPPGRLLGALAGDYQGAWIENGVAFCNAGTAGTIRFPLPSRFTRAEQAALLAGLVTGSLAESGARPLPPATSRTIPVSIESSHFQG